jgi:tryptophanyl-tRNA synthetase
MDCKKALHGHMIETLTPIRRRAEMIDAEPARVHDALADGGRVAQAIAAETMRDVRERMGLDPVRTPAAH